MKFLALIVLVPSLAFATGTPPPEAVAPVATATASADAAAEANAAAIANAAGGSGGEASANNTGNVVTSSTTITQERQAPAGFLTATNTTASCFKARGLFLSGPGAGLGVNGGKIDKDCALLLAGDEELRRGNVDASIKLRCASKLYQGVFTEAECIQQLTPAPKPAPEKTAVVIAPKAEPRCVTTDQLDRAFKTCAGTK